MENIWRKAQAARDRRPNFDSCLIVFSAHIEELIFRYFPNINRPSRMPIGSLRRSTPW